MVIWFYFKQAFVSFFVNKLNLKFPRTEPKAAKHNKTQNHKKIHGQGRMRRKGKKKHKFSKECENCWQH